MKHIFLLATSLLTVAMLSMCKKDLCDSCGEHINDNDTTRIDTSIIDSTLPDTVDVDTLDVTGPKIYSNILLELYTGQGCGNCPEAHIVMENLVQAYGKRVIPMSVHAGFFANDQFLSYANLGTETGEIYDSEFGNSSAGNPNGLVNRINITESTKVHSIGQWQSSIQKMIEDPAPLSIEI